MKTRLFVFAISIAALLASPARGQDAVTVKVRLYSSVITGIKDTHALAISEPMTDYIASNVTRALKTRVIIDLDVHHGETLEDLKEFGTLLDNGTYHWGLVWGIEWVWLKNEKKFENLSPAVVCLIPDTIEIKSQLIVGESVAGEKLSDLRGKRLAVYPSVPLGEHLFLEKLLTELKADRDSFFKVIKYDSFKEAVDAVVDKKADCIVCAWHTFERLKRPKPKVYEPLRVVASSESLAPPVFVGRQDLIDKRTDTKEIPLWTKLVDEFTLVPKTHECLKFWRVANFARPNKDNFQPTKNIDQFRDVLEMRAIGPN